MKALTRNFSFFIISLIGLALLWIADISLGSIAISTQELIEILLGKHEGTPHSQIIYRIRLPKSLVAVLAGSALSVAGLQMQALFRNPLAGPSVLGISSGSTLGVAVAVFLLGQSGGMQMIRQLGLGTQWLLIFAAIAGAVLTLLVVLLIASRVSNHASLLIIGLMIGNMTMALVGIWQYFSAPEQIKDFLLWTFGSLEGVHGEQLWILTSVVALGLTASIFLTKPLNLLLLGEAYAQSMGIHLKSARLFIILVAGVLAGSITGFCGPIAFVGIAVPHLCRSLLQTSNYLLLFPACILLGACLMLGCDVLAHLPGTHTILPINAVTSLIGSPIVIWVIVKKS